MMRAKLSRSQTLNRFAVALPVVAVAVLAYLAFPLLTAFRSETPIPGPSPVKTVASDAADGKLDDASRHRIQQMEDELKALQAEAAKNPARPTVAEMKRELDRMVAARHGESDVTRLERLVEWSLGLSLVLAIALTGLAVSNLRRVKTDSAAA
jgi:hypothetical protein